jgi:hypothetical protein
MNGQSPSIGRVVHYVAYGTPGGEYAAGAHRAAVMTDVSFSGTGDGESTVNVSLCILNPTGMFFAQHVPYDEHGMKPGSWHWPERTA